MRLKPAADPLTEVVFKCACMSAERIIMVTARTEADDVVQWLEQVVRYAVTMEHAKLSPVCRQRTLEYVKLLAPEGKPVGSPPTAN